MVVWDHHYIGGIGLLGGSVDGTGWNNNKGRVFQLNLQTDIGHLIRVEHPILKHIIIDSNSKESSNEMTLT